MKHFYIIANRIKDKDLTVAGEIEQYLKAHGCRCTVETEKPEEKGRSYRYTDPDGELGISDEGWDTIKQWIQNGHMEAEGEDYVGSVIDGSRPICEMWGSGVLQNEEERGVEFQIMSPEVGVP